MQTIVVPAVKIIQGDLILYGCSFRVSDLIRKNFYAVDTLDPEEEKKGYQRLLNKGRAKKLADYIIDGMETKEAFLPTSIFIATHKSIEHNAATNTIAFDLDEIGPFAVVDGQHRLEGLRMAAEEDERVKEFMVSVNVAVKMPFPHQMAHFYIVNSTQKSVDKSVEQRIMARLTDILDVDDDAPSLPAWIERSVKRGDNDRALKIADFLNSEPTSPWRGKIEMANQSLSGTTIKQMSFVKLTTKNVLNPSNTLGGKDVPIERIQKLLLNYWRAIAAILATDNQETVLFKYLGCEVFHRFSHVFFLYMENQPDRKPERMQAILKAMFDNVSGDYAGIGHPDYWKSGGPISFMNSSALSKVVGALSESLHSLGRSVKSGVDDL